jgi:aldose 1-epimerase
MSRPADSSSTASVAGGDELRVTNAHGASATFSPFGARLVELCLPDRDGNLDNLVLGFDDEDTYRNNVALYFGATVGRVAGRIAGGSFTLDGQRYDLARNEGRNHLHGGRERSFDRVHWEAERVASNRGAGVAFEYLSPHLEEGYPGNLKARAEYFLSDSNELWTVFTAVADAPTPVNMTNHAYWNLNGAGSESILDHELRIAAGRIVAMDDELLPTGTLEPVADTVRDFRVPRRLGEQLPEDGSEPWPGFDSAYVLDERDAERDVAVSLWDPTSGRAMDVITTEPSIQMYTANRLADMIGRDGRRYRAGNAICLEPQRFPDAVNRPEFPSIVVAAGEQYRHVSCYRFSVR